jgi:hypothetical protein
VRCLTAIYTWALRNERSEHEPFLYYHQVEDLLEDFHLVFYFYFNCYPTEKVVCNHMHI